MVTGKRSILARTFVPCHLRISAHSDTIIGMKLFNLSTHATTIGDFASKQARIVPVVHPAGDTHVHLLYLGRGGLLGYHQAIENQLFFVVSGDGWVRGDTSEHVPITAGQAAFWEAGEWHESGTETGMTAVVIEGKDLEPDEL